MEHSSLLKVKYFFKCPSCQWGLFTCSDHVWLIHSIRSIYSAWSAIWIICSCSVFCYDILAHFSSFFIRIQRQSILLPAEWPCIFLVHLSYVYIFFSVVRLVRQCAGFSLPALSELKKIPSRKSIPGNRLPLIRDFLIVQLFISVAWFRPCNFVCQSDYYMQCLNKFIDSAFFLLALNSQCKQWTLKFRKATNREGRERYRFQQQQQQKTNNHNRLKQRK